MLPNIGQRWKEKDKDHFSEDKEVEGVNQYHNAAPSEQPFREGIICYNSEIVPSFFSRVKKKFSALTNTFLC